MNSRRRASSSTTSTSGPLGRAAGAGALEERLEVAAPVAAVAARACRRPGTRPWSDHLRIVDWATPRNFAAWPSVSQSGSLGRRASAGVRHAAKSSQSCRYLNGLWVLDRDRHRFARCRRERQRLQRPDERLRAARRAGCRRAPARRRSRPRRRAEAAADDEQRRIRFTAGSPSRRGRRAWNAASATVPGFAARAAPRGRRRRAASRAQSSAPS